MIPKAFIATPLEQRQVDRISEALAGRVEIIHEPDLLPEPRFPADHRGVDRDWSDADLARWNAHLAEAEFLWDIPPLVRLPSPDMSWARNLRWVQCSSSGVGQMVSRLGLAGTGIEVTTARGVHAEPLAEFALMAILMHVRDHPRLKRDQADHRWARYCNEGLRDKTVAVIAAGEIGHRVAEVCGVMGMRVLGMSRSLTRDEGRARGYDRIFRRDDLLAILSECDAVVLCIPHTSDTENMIDAAAIAAMKPGGVLVNIARGQVVDEAALIAALRSGQIGSAALDVAAIEPLPEDSPLWDLPNVLMSPHSASTLARENMLIADLFIHNAQCILDNRLADLRNRFDMSAG